MKKKQSKTYYIHCRVNNKQILNEIDKIVISLSKRNRTQFSMSDIIRKAIEQYIRNQKADGKM